MSEVILSLWKKSICLRELLDEPKSNWMTLTLWSVERRSWLWRWLKRYLEEWILLAETSNTFSAGMILLSQSNTSPPSKLPKLLYSWIKFILSYKGTWTQRNRRGILLKIPALNKSRWETIQKSWILNKRQV